MGMPKISVVIPTYNREEYIPLAIDSILKQTFRDCEIIVVDDGSTDKTADVLKKYENLIRYIYQQNKGVSAARNTGIRAAQGEWVAFLDSDDEWLPDYLGFQVNEISRNEKAEVYITNALNISVDGSIINYFEDRGIAHFCQRDKSISLNNPLCFVIGHHVSSLQSAVMRRRTVLEAGLFDERLTIAEDHDLFARMSLRGSFVFLNKELVHIIRRRESINNLTTQLKLEGIRRRRANEIIYKKIRSYGELCEGERALINKCLGKNQRALANLFLRSGKVSEARYHYREALHIYPSVGSVVKYVISLLPARAATWFIWKGRSIAPSTEKQD